MSTAPSSQHRTGPARSERGRLPLAYPVAPDPPVRRLFARLRSKMGRAIGRVLHGRRARDRDRSLGVNGRVATGPPGLGARVEAPPRAAAAPPPATLPDPSAPKSSAAAAVPSPPFVAPPRPAPPPLSAAELPPPGELIVPPSEVDAADAPAGDLSRATLHLLPGRLQSVRPASLRQEIRFVRLPGPEQTVMLGREAGDPLRRVAVDHASVHAHHARLCYRDGSWSLESLCDGGSTAVNGLHLDLGRGPRVLQDGDRIRLGEVEFRFKMP